MMGLRLLLCKMGALVTKHNRHAQAFWMTLTKWYLNKILGLLCGSTCKAMLNFEVANHGSYSSARVVHMPTARFSRSAHRTPDALLAWLGQVSDILHNSSAPVRNATSFRTHLEARLPEVFESLQEVRVGLGRITGEELKKRVLTCLRAWGDWFVFPEQYLTGLQVRPSSHRSDGARQQIKLRTAELRSVVASANSVQFGVRTDPGLLSEYFVEFD